MSSPTISDWVYKFRGIVVGDLARIYRQKIGGVGRFVQIHECKFGEIECDENSDKKEPKWVLGALDSETKDLRIGLLPGNKRSRETIKPLLESFVKRGSTIISDCSSSFDFLDEPTSGFIHEKIDRSKSLVITKGDTKIHTNNIIATWRPFKDFFRTRRLAVENFHFALKDFEWRRMMRLQKKDEFLEFLKLCAKTYKPKLLDHLPHNVPIDLPE
ncbi:hypothetical protein SSS_06570 [Sarcoptes scabiei]|nr:hypothetical protein SSS_06570 [Sarcoptes scabiei]